MRFGRNNLALAAFLIVSVQGAFAGPILGGSTGLTNPQHVIGFDEVSLNFGTLVTDQFSAYGATFSGLAIDPVDAMGGAGSTGFSGAAYLYGGFDVPGPVVISFNSPVRDAVFAAVDTGDTWTLEAFRGGLNGTLVDTMTLAIAYHPGQGFVGFTDQVFDTIRISGPGGGIGIDTLQFNTVPEPGTYLLVSVALAGLFVRRKLNSRNRFRS